MEVGQLEILESCRQLSAKNKFNKIELDYHKFEVNSVLSIGNWKLLEDYQLNRGYNWCLNNKDFNVSMDNLKVS